MRQGDIWIVNLDPTEGSEQAGHRPVVIVSGDALNKSLPIAIVVPLSSSVKSYPTSVLLHPNVINGLTKETEALPFQVRTLAKDRFDRKIGTVSSIELGDIIRALFFVLTH